MLLLAKQFVHDARQVKLVLRLMQIQKTTVKMVNTVKVWLNSFIRIHSIIQLYALIQDIFLIFGSLALKANEPI